MQHLSNLAAPKGANKRRKRVGRGESSGAGKTAGRGGKGQTARTGKGKPALGFEGGQMPMYRRMPKRGFRNIFARKAAVFNVDRLGQYFEPNSDVDLAALRSRGLANKTHQVFRVLGHGELKHALNITADHVSTSAKEKVTAAGGKVTIVKRAPAARAA